MIKSGSRFSAAGSAMAFPLGSLLAFVLRDEQDALVLISALRQRGNGLLRGEGRDAALEIDVEGEELIAGEQAGRAIETPLADTAGIDVDEIRVRVVANAAAMEGESCFAQLERVDARHAQVDGFGLNVEAVLGDAVSVSAKRFVRRRSAIAADDVDLAAGMTDRDRQIVEDIVETGIEMANVAGAMIAEEIIELGERGGNELVATAVNNISPLGGVRVVKQQMMILALRRGQLLRGHPARLGTRAGQCNQEQHRARNP